MGGRSAWGESPSAPGSIPGMECLRSITSLVHRAFRRAAEFGLPVKRLHAVSGFKPRTLRQLRHSQLALCPSLYFIGVMEAFKTSVDLLVP